jgi:hypothetical protein
MMTAAYIYIQTVMEHDIQKHVFFWALSIGYIYLLRKALFLKGYEVYVKDSRTENFDNYYPCRKKKLDVT